MLRLKCKDNYLDKPIQIAFKNSLPMVEGDRKIRLFSSRERPENKQINV